MNFFSVILVTCAIIGNAVAMRMPGRVKWFGLPTMAAVNRDNMKPWVAGKKAYAFVCWSYMAKSAEDRQKLQVELDSSMFRRATVMTTETFTDLSEEFNNDAFVQTVMQDTQVTRAMIDQLKSYGDNCNLLSFDIPSGLNTRDSYQIKLRIPHLNGYWRSTYSEQSNIVISSVDGDMPKYDRSSYFTSPMGSLRRASWNRQKQTSSQADDSDSSPGVWAKTGGIISNSATSSYNALCNGFNCARNTVSNGAQRGYKSTSDGARRSYQATSDGMQGAYNYVSSRVPRRSAPNTADETINVE